MSKLCQLACLIVVASASLAAQVASSTVETSGMVGLASGETAQLNLLNPGFPATATAIPATCSATVSFLDASGKVLKSAVLTIASGKSAALTLTDREANLTGTERSEIRATLAIAPVPVAVTNPVAATCTYVKTLEVYDNLSLRTLLALGDFRDVTVPTLSVAP